MHAARSPLCSKMCVYVGPSHRLDRIGIYHFWHKIEKKIVSGREGSHSIGSSFIRIGIQFRSE